MDVVTLGIERWLAPHVARLGPVTAIEARRADSINQLERGRTLIVGFEYLDSFAELGSLVDFLHIAGHLNRLGRLMMLSSYCVYAPKDTAYREDDALAPQNYVGARASMLEDALTYLAERFETGLTVLRLFNVYGSFQDDSYVVPTILRSAAYGSPLLIGGAEKRRGFLHVADFVDLLALALERPTPRRAIYNVGSDVPVSIRDLVQSVARVTGRKVTPLFDATKVRSEFDYDFAVPDLRKVKSALGWSPSTSLDDGLRLTYQWILGRSAAGV